MGGPALPHEPPARRGGDDTAFRDLAGPLRAQLHAHCYRMLGSVDDADDALQEVLLRAWRGLAGFEGRSSVRSWLYRIATNVCLNLIRQRPKRVLPLDHGLAADPRQGSGEPLVESVWLEPYYYLDLTALGRQEDWEQPRGRADHARPAVPDFAE